ncbi:PP2C family protein-serine/threonine phosphatase [Streptomyces sp. NPDC090056]|uniref:PP2C family protein-serine/threonine phosphatase n=1 Tax=Streptomyces sp. NPDC090056 TaxID=3365934 RepID=UPI0038072C31
MTAARDAASHCRRGVGERDRCCRNRICGTGLGYRAGIGVGGDFYDLFHTHGHSYAAVLGDVCGKGVKAAQVSAMVRYTIRADAGEAGSPADLLDRLNTALLAQKAPAS